MNKDLKHILSALFWLVIIILIVGYVGVVILNETEQQLYQHCCYEHGGEILVTALGCDYMPSDCAYCSVDIDINKDCSYNLTLEVD